LLAIGALCLAAGLVLSWAAGSLLVGGSAGDVPPAAAPARDFRLRTPDGLDLAATYWPGARADAPAILLLHGVNASRRQTAPTAAWLATLGYAALTVDLRGNGQSPPVEHGFGLTEATDARAAFDWLEAQQRGAPVAVIGSSMGGAAALLGPSGPLPADALVLQAVYPDIRLAIRNRIAHRLGAPPARLLEPLLSFQSLPRLGVWPSALSPRAAIRRFRGPVFVIGGGEDRSTPPAETRALFDAAPGPKRLWLVPGRGHAAMGDLADPPYRTRLRAFLEATIGRP
jgi:pimeloyl-ACP methyl ester carboxylesterase